MVNVYDFDVDGAKERLDILVFDAPNRDWLSFVVHNRREGRSADCMADIICGPVANDDVFETVALYEAGIIGESAAIERFKVKDLFDQVLFCNERALGFLSFVEAREIEV